MQSGRDIIWCLCRRRKRLPSHTFRAERPDISGEQDGKTLRALRKGPRRGPEYQPRAQRDGAPVRAEPSARPRHGQRRDPPAARVHALPPIEQGHQGRIAVRQAVSSPAAPAAIGPYSQAVHAGGFLFVSGQVPIDPATGSLIAGDIGAQTHRALQNIGEILKAAGASFDHVVRTTVYLADLNDFTVMNEVYAQYFSSPAPARATIQAVRLPKDARIEIDVIASL